MSRLMPLWIITDRMHCTRTSYSTDSATSVNYWDDASYTGSGIRYDYYIKIYEDMLAADLPRFEMPDIGYPIVRESQRREPPRHCQALSGFV